MIGKRVSCSYYLRSFIYVAMITFLSSISSNAMVSLALSPESISIIAPSPKTLCLTLSPMENVAIYLSSLLIYFFLYIPKQLEWRIWWWRLCVRGCRKTSIIIHWKLLFWKCMYVGASFPNIRWSFFISIFIGIFYLSINCSSSRI